MALKNLSVPSLEGNEALLMPKLQNRFRVIMEPTGTNADQRRIITTNVVSVTRPTLSFPEVVLDTYNSKVYIPGKHEWQTIDIVIRDVVSSDTVIALDRQLNKQLDMASQAAPLSASSFKFTTLIQTLSGFNGGQEPIGRNSAEVLDTWDLRGCYIQSMSYGNNDYSSSEPVTITVTLRYDNAIHSTASDSDTLSGQPVETDTITATNGG